MNLTHIPAIALGVVSIGALAACGQPTQARSETPAQIWRELAVCARAHGDPSFPDPTVDAQGQAHFPPGTQKPPAATLAACQSIYNRLPASVRGNDAPDIPMALKFAQCMRAHGMPELERYITYGASPRATIHLIEGARHLVARRSVHPDPDGARASYLFDGFRDRLPRFRRTGGRNRIL